METSANLNTLAKGVAPVWELTRNDCRFGIHHGCFSFLVLAWSETPHGSEFRS
jgi:hypothetical protein